MLNISQLRKKKHNPIWFEESVYYKYSQLSLYSLFIKINKSVLFFYNKALNYQNRKKCLFKIIFNMKHIADISEKNTVNFISISTLNVTLHYV